MIAFGLNIPEVSNCSGVGIADVCVSSLGTGLVLGTAALVLVRALKALQQQGRGLSGAQADQPRGLFVGIPPRISLVRLAPPPVNPKKGWRS